MLVPRLLLFLRQLEVLHVAHVGRPAERYERSVLLQEEVIAGGAQR